MPNGTPLWPRFVHGFHHALESALAPPPVGLLLKTLKGKTGQSVADPTTVTPIIAALRLVYGLEERQHHASFFSSSSVLLRPTIMALTMKFVAALLTQLGSADSTFKRSLLRAIRVFKALFKLEQRFLVAGAPRQFYRCAKHVVNPSLHFTF